MPPPPMIQEFNFSTFAKFIHEFSSILFPVDRVFIRGKYLFRGQGSASYELKTSFDRAFVHLSLPQRVQKYEKLINFLAEEFDRIHKPNLGELERLSLAQHYGTPTRLLDWTSSPLIAAYFAFHQRLSSRPADRHVTIWALDSQDLTVWNKRQGVEVSQIGLLENQRAFRQLGFVTNLTTPDETIETYVARVSPNKTALWKFNIRSSDAKAAFAFLDSCNIRATELFGDVDGAVKSAMERLFLVDGP